MRIALGSDERTALTDELAEALREAGHEVELFGPLAGGDEEWVAASAATARAVADGRADRGVVCCWSGTGASIAANKVRGVRAALCGDAETARMARQVQPRQRAGAVPARHEPADGPRDRRGVPRGAGRGRRLRPAATSPSSAGWRRAEREGGGAARRARA